MWPFNKKSTPGFKVEIFIKRITQKKETYTFTASSKKQARIKFLLWWWKDHPLMVIQKENAIVANDIFICESDILTDKECRMIESHMTRNQNEDLTTEDISYLNNLIQEAKQLNIIL